MSEVGREGRGWSAQGGLDRSALAVQGLLLAHERW